MHFLPSKSVQSQKIGSWICVNRTNAIAALVTGVFLKHWMLSSGGNLVVFFLIAWFNQNLCSSQLVAWMFNMICMIWWKSLMRLSVGSLINSCIQTNAFLIMAWMWTWYMIYWKSVMRLSVCTLIGFLHQNPCCCHCCLHVEHDTWFRSFLFMLADLSLLLCLSILKSLYPLW